MSKTSQRKRQAYQDGLSDSGYGFRWKKHPYMKEYAQGYRDAELAKKKKYSFTDFSITFFLWGAIFGLVVGVSLMVAK